MKNKIRKNVFITGATGFLGSALAKELLRDKNTALYALVRGKDNVSFAKRTEVLYEELTAGKKHKADYGRIKVMKGDITKRDLGLSGRLLDKLNESIKTVYHCAAVPEFSSGGEAIKRANVGGVENILRLALRWRRHGRLENVNYISTAYVAGDYSGMFYEKWLDVRQNFHNDYERSKFEAEKTVYKYRELGLPVDIYRPSIIIDDPSSVRKASAVLQLLAVFVLELFDKIPADENSRLNMITVRSAAKIIHMISTKEGGKPDQTYHVVNPRPVKLGWILDVASGFFKFKKPKCIPAGRFNMRMLTPVQREIISPFMPYLNQKLDFDMSNIFAALKRPRINVPSVNKEGLINTFRRYRLPGHKIRSRVV